MNAAGREVSWTPIAEPPPQGRIVLLALYHQAEPVLMRGFDMGAWMVDPAGGGRTIWHLQGKGYDFEAWGWRLLAWWPLPDWPGMEPNGCVA